MIKRKVSSKKPSPAVRGGVKKTHTPKTLGSFQDAWSSTPTPDVSMRGRLPEGTYKAVIEEALIDGDQVKMVFTITEGDFKNRKAFKNMQLGDEGHVGISILKGDLVTLGQTAPDNVEELPEVLAGLAGKHVEIFNRVKFSEKHGREFANVFINGIIEETSEAETEVETESEPEVETKEAAAEVEVGALVSFKDGKKTYKGEVIAVSGFNATVEADGEEWEVEVDDLTVETPSESEVEEAPKAAKSTKTTKQDMIGKSVQFECDGETQTGVVISIDKKGNYEV